MSTLTDRVRRRMASDPGNLDDAIRAEAGVIDDAVLAHLRIEVGAALIGAGALEPLLRLPGVTDVLVNGPDSVWFDRGYGLERSEITFEDSSAVRSLAQRLVMGAGRRLDDASPFADAVLADGTRVHAVLPPITPQPLLSLRVFTQRWRSLDDLVLSSGLSADAASILTAVVLAQLTCVITGGTGAGKTTLLAAMLGLVAANQRIVIVEDTPELAVGHPHVVALSARPANVEGAGAVGLRDLVTQSLRMRPDRLVVGEFRGAEMVELLVALNTGHEGGAATLHANEAAAVPSRLLALGGLAGLTREAVARLAGAALHVVVHVQRIAGVRRVEEIAVLDVVGNELRVQPAWTTGNGREPAAAILAAKISSRGIAVPAVLL